jgi:DNA-binding HxlR family transcriptional regulator
MDRGFGQFCPVAMASEVFAQRWTPMVLRELLAGSHHFNEILQGMPLISRGLLVRRLRELEQAGVICTVPLPGRRGREYHLTTAGEEFREVIDCLGSWGQRWTMRVDPKNLDAGLLMWNMRRRIALDRLLPRKIVVRFDFRGVPKRHGGPRTFWLLLQRSDIDLCVKDPGLDIDLHVDADLAAMASVWLGDLTMSSALNSDLIQLTGPRPLVRAFTSWLLLSKFANVPRPVANLMSATQTKTLTMGQLRVRT